MNTLQAADTTKEGIRRSESKSMLEYAVGYQAIGWLPIPLCWPNAEGGCACGRQHGGKNVGKAPLLGEGYQNIRPTELSVRKWWGLWPDANIGILLEPSDLLVVDCDSPDAIEEAKKLGLPPSPTATTGQGLHIYFKSDGIIGRTTKRGVSHAIDILAAGYVVAPPSKHRTGRRYSWITSPAL